MRTSGRLGAVVVAGLLGGCAAPVAHAPSSAPAAQAVATDARQRLSAAEALCQQLAADPALAPLRGRLLPPEPSVPWTRAMMVDTRYVDERDRALLVLMDERRARCRQALITASPGQAVPFLDYWGRQDAALVRLYDRRIAIGAYNRAMADAQAQFAIDVTNQRADSAARANQHIVEPPPQDPARRADPAPQYSPDSFRALGGR
jgi:hypothetical protein